ncbi:hypothetical protein [Psychroflexus sp. MES1-P1E]|uniref:hypothetical protein n=1 Tax=Psychroflexus sp. MES1-P1E TaxID=2058320 RepID=UPI000C7DE1CE|nr:hypothetical protein [Psychroflexus sp. MES1-P1E]PKG43872.1 hypothetical protein CXF67_02730 [Psychroflexus sp. MES1-P1E]
MSISCSSSDDSDSNSLEGEDYMRLARNGETYEETFMAYALGSGYENCADTSSNLDATLAIVYIENSEFSFTLGMAHEDLKSDFDETSDSFIQVSTEVDGLGVNDSECLNNFELIMYYDETDKDLFVDDSQNNTNTIENIFVLNDSQTETEYGIQGRYEVSYTDGSDYNITITGDYILAVDALK